ncbi:MAG: hypothetical protein FP825_13175 [Hyphomonas sp.]|uniref:DUF6498-containing protein n=1 Tax=Hyphomonas sp. TaxID=87 RepID=UPI00184502B8|nr:DUF6498-containing protein [Hyphomonas sp.]MBA3069417.1 hypothetical protein [Hyphomonas sp.]MBU3920293.1 hypothetical protein [Alphaproteobacteria bacterium]MBU4063799.1 hypothetical protein [Alphaproteobacteria bacterium]MBU4164240.1 hypothetical protein [Alphaproteobacteria bacterium]
MKGRFLDPSEIARAYRDPLSWVSLAVDLLPVVAVFAFGWAATPLVALYWLENLVIGVFTVLRMVGTAIASSVSFVMALFTVPFFFFHYGLFCFGHGVFLNAFATGGNGGSPDPLGLIRWAFGTAPEMWWFVSAIAAVSSIYLLVDFFGRGEYKTSNPGTEMFAPYGRIVTLHIAIILGAAVAFTMDEPLLGVLLLIFIRVIFGVIVTVMRRRKRDAQVAPIGAP